MATPSARAKDILTFEEAAQLDPDLYAGELDAGSWVPVVKNTWRHGEIVVNVTVVLKTYAKAHPGWSVSSADPGTKLGVDPDRLRGPDVGMVRSERRPQGRGAQGWLEGAPDLAVEVIGDAPSHVARAGPQPKKAMDRRRKLSRRATTFGRSSSDLAGKALEYLAAGGKMVWVLDAEPRRVILYRPPDHVRVLGADEILDGGEVLPGFSCRVADLFE